MAFARCTRLLLALAAALGLASCQGSNCTYVETKDGRQCSLVPELDALCTIAQGAAAQPSLTQQQYAEHMQAELKKLRPSTRLLKLMRAIGEAAPERKYPMWLEAARADGAEDWSCPAILEGYSRFAPAKTTTSTKTATATATPAR